MKSVVLPLEEEVQSLKQKLRSAYAKLDELEGTKASRGVGHVSGYIFFMILSLKLVSLFA